MFLLPTQREVYDAVGNPRKPGASSWSYDGGSSNERGGSSSGGSHMTFSPYDGDSSYERGASSLGGSNGTSSPGTGCTRGAVQNSPISYSSHQSSCHGSEYDLEADLDSELSTERMRSIVSSILPDDGLDTPSDRWSIRSPSAQAFLRDQELRWQYQDRWESNGVFEPRGDQTFHAVRLRSNNGSARFPSTEMDGFPNEERNHYQIPKEQESDTGAAFLGIPIDTCVDANLSYLSGSQHNGSGHGNPTMMREHQQYTMNAQELYFKEMPKSVEITRACCVNGGNAADVNLLLENLGITDRNSAEQKNKPLVWHLSKMPYQQGWQTTNIEWAELKNIRETNGLNLQQIRSYPANEHVWPHETLETGFSSPLPPIIDTDNSVSSTLAKSCNGSAAGYHSVGSDFPFPGRRQENRGTTSPKNPHVYNCNCDSPPQRQIVDSSQTKRIINRPTFLPRTPNGQTSVRSAIANNEYPLSQTPLPKQNLGSKYRAAHAGEDAWRTPENLVQFQHSPATKARPKQGRRRGRKAVFQKGQTSISVVLDPKTVAPRIRRQLNVSDANVLQLIPVEHPRTKLDVCTQGQYKTELCNKWQTKGCCPYGDQCMYAHGVQELRCVIRHPRYKSQLCHKFAAGLPCHYGHRCHYRHSLQSDPDELTVISTLSVRVMGATS